MSWVIRRGAGTNEDEELSLVTLIIAGVMSLNGVKSSAYVLSLLLYNYYTQLTKQ